MTDTFGYEDDYQQQPLDPNIREQLKRAEKDRRGAESARLEAQQAKRELALYKAGVPAEGPGELFHKAYDGPLDAEAIRAEAIRYGVLQVAEPESTPEPQPAQDPEVETELKMMREQQSAMAGQWGNQQPDPSQEFLAEIKGANSTEEVLEVINRLGGETGVQTSGMR